ncbi:hypothetical protein VNI00_010249 [Paramarasmius palmivorus]|uniref:F-box domain-containing protein n=1 Tax=Paramarasmius palmivorus TaxID=297713 RepID=A0AAW0CH78_9AGAR
MAQTNPNIFPPEIIREIFLHCPHDKSTLVSNATPWTLAQVNCTWRGIGCSTPELGTQIYIDSETATSRRIKEMIPEVVKRTNGRLVDIVLDFPGLHAENSKRMFQRACRAIIQYVPPFKWHSLKTGNIYPGQVRGILSTFQSAHIQKDHYVSLRRIHTTSDALPQIIEGFGHLPRWVDLCVDRMPPSLARYIPPQLTVLAIERVGGTQEVQLLCARAPDLHTLSVPQIRFRSEDGCLNIPKLQNLTLQSWPEPFSFTTCQFLYHLSISRFSYEAETIGEEMAKIHLPNLRSLVLSRCAPMDRTLVRVLHSAINLEKLTLSGHFGDHLFLSLLPGDKETIVPKLNTLIITVCPIFDNTLLRDVIRLRSLNHRCSVFRYTQPNELLMHEIDDDWSDGDAGSAVLDLRWTCRVQIGDLVRIGVKDSENLPQLVELIARIEDIVADNRDIRHEVFESLQNFPGPCDMGRMYSSSNDEDNLASRLRALGKHKKLWVELTVSEKACLFDCDTLTST